MRSELGRFAAMAVVALAACNGGGGGGGGNGTQPEGGLLPSAVDCNAGSSTIHGRFLTPNGTVAVAGGLVTVSTAAGCKAGTDQTGAFEFRNVPSSKATVSATKGLFSATAEAVPGVAVEVRIDPASVRIAYVAGDYDSIETVVQRLGFTPEALISSDLAQAAPAQLDVLLLNCGMDESYATDEGAAGNLRSFVQGGGVLYASDWAFVYVDGVWPGKIGFLADSPEHPGAPYVGDSADALQASVAAPALRLALGKDTASISFDLSEWVVVDSVASGVDVLLSGPAPLLTGSALSNKPYAVQFADGSGRVTFTSFHNEAQTTADMDRLLEQMLLGL